MGGLEGCSIAWFWFCNILFGQEWEYIVFIAFLVQWQLHNHFSFDNIFLWPKRIGRGKGTVHVKSFPYIEQFLPHGPWHGILNLGHISSWAWTEASGKNISFWFEETWKCLHLRWLPASVARCPSSIAAFFGMLMLGKQIGNCKKMSFWSTGCLCWMSFAKVESAGAAQAEGGSQPES